MRAVCSALTGEWKACGALGEEPHAFSSIYAASGSMRFWIYGAKNACGVCGVY